MIEIERIQYRRQEIAQIKHADSVYRDIVARENERAKYEKRWFWELLQNAKDSVDKDGKINVKLEIEENHISFMHTGNAFELDDILSLIVQGSSKGEDEEKVGRFGTGFMTTYLLSKEVRITGKLSGDDGFFDFVLNRNATNKDEFFNLQKDSNEHFEKSISENSYLGDSEYQTRFCYNLNDKGKRTADIGLESLDILIPITQLFNDQIEGVTILESDSEKTFSKIYKHKHEDVSIDEWEVSTFIDGRPKNKFRAYIYKNDIYNACFFTTTDNEIETIMQLSDKFPRIYFTFPLIGTEELGIPVIINSKEFKPKIERDGIYLSANSDSESVIKNKDVLKGILKECIPLFLQFASDKNINGIFELFNIQLTKEIDWLDSEWLDSVKVDIFSDISNKPMIKSNKSDEYISLNDIVIPFVTTNEHLRDLWKLMADLRQIKIPIIDELDKWIFVMANITKLQGYKSIEDCTNVWGINKLISYIEKTKTLIL